MKTLIIVPAYNEALNIKKAVENIKEETKYDYLIINDCSKDETRKVCEENGFNCISLPINYGLTSAIQLGMKYAYQKGYDIVIQFDGDGQHRAEYLKDLVEEIEKQECDIAIGSRFVKQKKTKRMRMLGSNLITLAIGITTGRKIKDSTSGMRAYNKKAIEEFVTNTSLTPEPDTLVYMLKKKFKIKEREFGESYLKPLKSAEYMINMFFSIIFIRAITRKKKKEELI